MRAWSSREVAAVIILSLAPAACVLTTHPVVGERDATFDTRLLGAWVAGSSGEVATVTRGDGAGYHIAYADDSGEVARFSGRVGVLGTRTVLDLWPADGDVDAPAGGLFVPHHLLFSVEFHGAEIHTALLEVDSVEAAITAGRLSADYTVSNNRLILSANTSDLRRSLAELVSRPEVFSRATVWKRSASQAPVAPSGERLSPDRGSGG